jgi:hypothetical protein
MSDTIYLLIGIWAAFAAQVIYNWECDRITNEVSEPKEAARKKIRTGLTFIVVFGIFILLLIFAFKTFG